MNRNEMSLEIESDPRNESFARVVVASFMTRINPTLEEVADVKTAVSEAVTNAIVHGYDEGEGRIIIKAVTDVEERTLEVWITDCGTGIEDIKSNGANVHQQARQGKKRYGIFIYGGIHG